MAGTDPIADISGIEHYASMKIRLILCALALASCHQASTRQAEVKEQAAAEDCDSLPKLDVNNAKADARAAWSRKERHLLGVYGYAVETPGIGRPKLPVRMIEQTSDSGCSEANELIRRYATVYNREIMAALADG